MVSILAVDRQEAHLIVRGIFRCVFLSGHIWGGSKRSCNYYQKAISCLLQVRGLEQADCPGACWVCAYRRFFCRLVLPPPHSVR